MADGSDEVVIVHWPSLTAYELRRLVTDYVDDERMFNDDSNWTQEEIVVAVIARALAVVLELRDDWNHASLTDVTERLNHWLALNRRISYDDRG